MVWKVLLCVRYPGTPASRLISTGVFYQQNYLPVAWAGAGLKPLYLQAAMQKKLILDSDLLRVTIDRLCQELIENHGSFEHTVLLGLQPRGIYLAERIHQLL